MITLTGTYADDEQITKKFACRVFLKDKNNLIFVNGVDEEVQVEDGDVLVQFGDASWFALYTDDGKA